VLENLIGGEMTPDRAMNWAKVLWSILALVWLGMAFALKSVKRSETVRERIQHIVPLLLAFWLVLGDVKPFPWLHLRLLPGAPHIWWAGILITAEGMAIAIWARLTLGSNWSGMVTVKENHELIRTGLYSRIRHPIYTGILVGLAGSGIIRGQLRDLLGFLILLITLHFKAKREEGFLHQEFGPSFVEHQRHTGMFLPKLT
jgi:protein-S-isoprenylcysteine O-methyltransferase Ste14